MTLIFMRRIAAYEQNSTPLPRVAAPALCLDRSCAMFAVQESALDGRNNISREDTPGR